MEKEYQKGILRRLHVAYKETKRMLESNKATREIDMDRYIAKNWTIITASYSGLEQTLKFLVACEKECTISELIEKDDKDSSNSRQRSPYRTHNLSKLFKRLEKSTQCTMREYFSRFQSLHLYIPFNYLLDFLKEISGEKGKGYERWRYSLIEDEQLPGSSPTVLLALWRAGVYIAENGIYENNKFFMPDKVLEKELDDHLIEKIIQVCKNRQMEGESYKEIRPEIHAWLKAADHPLNAFAKVLWHFSRYERHGVKNVSDWFSDLLIGWAKRIEKTVDNSDFTLVSVFAKRAMGKTQYGQSIRWNPVTNRFENVPWSLKKELRETRPPGSLIVRDLNLFPLSLYDAVMDSGYQIAENRNFCQSDIEKWLRSLQVQRASDGDKEPVLTIWEQYCGDCAAIVTEIPEPNIKPSLRKWIRCARLGEQYRANSDTCSVPKN